MHIIIVSILLIASQVFFFHENLEFDDQEPLFSTEQLAIADEIIGKSKAKKVAKIEAKNIFKQSCSSCHGRKGGLGLGGAANLTKSKMPLREQVAMVYFGRNKMQSYKDTFDENELVALAGYLDTLKKSK